LEPEEATTVTERPIPAEVREQIVREASGALRLLNDPDLHSILDEIKWNYVNQLTSTAPHEKKAREDAYWAIRSLEVFVETLNRRLQRADLLREEEEQENTHDYNRV
jgi:hypothetical protein